MSVTELWLKPSFPQPTVEKKITGYMRWSGCRSRPLW